MGETGLRFLNVYVLKVQSTTHPTIYPLLDKIICLVKLQKVLSTPKSHQPLFFLYLWFWFIYHNRAFSSNFMALSLPKKVQTVLSSFLELWLGLWLLAALGSIFVPGSVLRRASHLALVVKNPPANAGDIRDVGSIPGSGRSPGGGHSNTLQYSYLENPMDRGIWQATVHSFANSQTRLKRLSTLTCCSKELFTYCRYTASLWMVKKKM